MGDEHVVGTGDEALEHHIEHLTLEDMAQCLPTPAICMPLLPGPFQDRSISAVADMPEIEKTKKSHHRSCWMQGPGGSVKPASDTDPASPGAEH